jgi:hypothetical protein
VKDSENPHNKAARRRQHNLQKPLNNTVQQDAKIQYSDAYAEVWKGTSQVQIKLL